ncbi:bifunctional hydroxymethylpyrimidine kinase/phosphomethylpyrimidine kinase [Neisseriaceae bacterium PsAf]|nr:bifunctional hydroxymethylpyrimidine kinase/phosphomethylpyrimidine kinase [Neisseriaceae bacterium PsAf]MCV2503201.1 bifunctional hydroxymethylpyrimidine kinase/phosphomethylpyrimidine kinase [Neisseriaceae bacterium]
MQSVLTIAGSDSGGGAGIQADLKTFQELKVFGTCVITAITAQNTQTVYSIQAVDINIITDQLRAVLEDFDITALKIGMLYSQEIIQAISPMLKTINKPLIVDPVMISKSNAILLSTNATQAFKQNILPITYLITPNIPEAEVLSNMKITSEQDIQNVAHQLLQQGAKNVLIKGGHLDDSQFAQDYLYTDDKVFRLSTPRINTPNTHGTGCTYSAAITAFLANGYSLLGAVIEAKKFIQMAIENPLHLGHGHGHGPINHFAYQEITSKSKVDVYEY